jgi:transposase
VPASILAKRRWRSRSWWRRASAAAEDDRTFRTVTRELLELREWLRAEQVTHVGMESTGIYWKPVYALLEDAFEMIVGNATRIKNVPGRKTDVKDSEWIADLLRHGLVAKSFVPPPPIRELRDLVRYLRKLVESRCRPALKSDLTHSRGSDSHSLRIRSAQNSVHKSQSVA